MGFMDAMKGANNSWGMATTNFLGGIAYIGPEKMADNKNHKIMLSGTGIETFVFGKEDVDCVNILAATCDWIKYRIVLKNGNEIYATLYAMTQGQKGKQISMGLLNFEWWLEGTMYK